MNNPQKNYLISIIENKENGKRMNAIVSLKRLNQLERLRTHSGLIKFNIDIQEESQCRSTLKTKINRFLSEIGIKTDIDKIYSAGYLAEQFNPKYGVIELR